MPDGDPYLPKVRVAFKRGGELAAPPKLVNPPSDPAWKAHAEAALKAVKDCDPLHVPDKYAEYYPSGNRGRSTSIRRGTRELPLKMRNLPFAGLVLGLTRLFEPAGSCRKRRLCAPGRRVQAGDHRGDAFRRRYSARIGAVIANDMAHSIFLSPLNPSTFPEKTADPDAAPNLDAWKTVNAQFVLTGSVEGGGAKLTARFRLWDVATGEQVAGEQFTATRAARGGSRI